jgi:Domain of unknown function (DUF4844)
MPPAVSSPDPHAQQLRQFIASAEFSADGLLYTGAKPETLRLRLQAQIDGLAERILALSPSQRDKAHVLPLFRATLAGIAAVDSEEREQVCVLLEQLMDILAIESSDGLLNSWLCGFDPPGTA